MKTSKRVILFYFFALFLMLVLGGVQERVLKIDFLILSLPQLAPGLAALLMLAIYKKDHVRLTFAVKGTQTLKYIGAIGIPLLVSGVLFFIYRQFIGPLSIKPIGWISLLTLVGSELIGDFGEELGWRGYLQRIVEGKLNVLYATMVVGLLWGLWHVFYYFQNGPLWILFFVLNAVELSVIMAWLLKGTDYNVVIAGLVHFAFNMSFYLLAAARPDIRLEMLMAIVWGIVAVVIILLNRKYFLSPHQKNIEG